MPAVSVLSELAEAKMTVLRCEATICTDPKCGHPLSDHSLLYTMLPGGRRPNSLGSCRGEFLGPVCKCGGWSE